LFSGGFAFGPEYNKTQYISFGLYQETDFISYFPRDLALLGLDGNEPNINRPFRLNQISFNAEVLSVFHVGYNKRLNEKFTYGVRGKIYSSLANINSTRNEGQFITENGENKRLLFGGNLGLGLDLGFTYQVNDQWYVDGSILDFGFISYTKDVENYEVEGDFVFEGIDPFFIGSTNPQTADQFWSDIEEEFEDVFEVDTTQTTYTRLRPVKFNASLNYAFGKKPLKDCNCRAEEGRYLNRIGGQLYAIARPRGPQLALTTYYYRRLLRGLSAKATYTVDSYSFSNIGLGISTNLGGFNMYLLTDNLLQYRNIYDAQSVSLQLGFNYVFRNDK
jgi:hypothetical protein